MRWVCPKAPWIECVADGCNYLAAPGETILTIDFAKVKLLPGDVVMAPHVIKRELWYRLNREDVTLYETENMLSSTNPWRALSDELRSVVTRPWFNYSAANSAVYGDTPRPLTPRRMIAHDLVNPARDIDVLFVGSMNPRRQTVLDALRLFGVKVHHIGTHNPVFMPELADVLRRTKVMLNVHFYVPGVFESFRCIPAVSHGAVVVSEESEGNEGAEHCIVCPYGKLIETVMETLKAYG